MFEMRAKMITVGLLGAAVMLPIDLAKADQLGHASWYSLPANITANGERMDPNELTAAHRSLPFGTRVLVENLSNGRSVVVRINDRGPFVGGRIIDLSKAAAASIGMIDAGTAKVRVTTATGGNALAALGQATAKARDGAASAAKAKVQMASAETPHKAPAAARPSKGQQVAAKASSRRTHIAKQPDAQAKVRVASASKRSHVAKSTIAKSIGAHIRVASASRGIYAAAAQASRLQTRRVIVVASSHPYAFLGATPGFMKPDRIRTHRAG
jgi:peptidoglycan lytic transglycosylase